MKQNNLVAKHARTYNKSAIHLDRKKALRKNGSSGKNRNNAKAAIKRGLYSLLMELF